MAVPEIFLNGTSISCYNDGLRKTVPNHKTALQLYNISLLIMYNNPKFILKRGFCRMKCREPKYTTGLMP
jgi:hypothetical protein